MAELVVDWQLEGEGQKAEPCCLFVAAEAENQAAVRQVRAVLAGAVVAEQQWGFDGALVILLCLVEVVGLVEVLTAVAARQQEYSVIAWRPQEVPSQKHLVI